MSLFLRPSRSIALGALCILAALQAALSPVPPKKTPTRDQGETPGSAPAVRVTLETIAVDRRGTWSAGTDVADIFPGSSGTLQKTLTLIGRQEQNPPREMLDLHALISPTMVPGAACRVRIDAETRRAVAGARAPAPGRGADRKSATVTLQSGEDRLVEIYASPITDGRLALKIRCGPPDGATGSGEPSLVDLTVATARGEEEKPLQSLKTDSLQAMLGREVTDLASFNVSLPDGEGGAKRYRREHLEVAISPGLISGGQVQLEVRISGELATISAAAPSINHPVDHRETLVLGSGQGRSIDLEIRSSGPEEGWSLVRYRFDLSGRF